MAVGVSVVAFTQKTNACSLAKQTNSPLLQARLRGHRTEILELNEPRTLSFCPQACMQRQNEKVPSFAVKPLRVGQYSVS